MIENFITMIENFMDWYNDGDGEKKLLWITVCIFLAAVFVDGTKALVLWLK